MGQSEFPTKKLLIGIRPSHQLAHGVVADSDVTRNGTQAQKNAA